MIMKNIIFYSLLMYIFVIPCVFALTADFSDGTKVDISLNDGTTADIGNVKVSYIIEESANDETKGYLYSPYNEPTVEPQTIGGAIITLFGNQNITTNNMPLNIINTTIGNVQFDWTFWVILGFIIIITCGIYWYKRRKKKEQKEKHEKPGHVWGHEEVRME